MRLGIWFVGCCSLLAACGGSSDPSDPNEPESVAAQSDELTSMVIEAETLTGGGTVGSDTAASGGKDLVFWSNGSASTTTTRAFQSITVRARGDQCSGAPHLVVSIDGKEVLSASVTATSWTDYSANVSLASAAHTVKVAFDNDFSGSCDRNLRLDKITVTSPDAVATIWEPTDLGAVTWTRPTGSAYVTWESLVSAATAKAQAASPNTPVLLTAAFMKAITGNKVLSLPKGIFEAENGFGHYVNNNMMGIGVGYAAGLRGIVGSGSHSTKGPGGAETVLRMHGTVGASPGVNQGSLLIANGIADPYFAGFSLMGTQTRGDNAFHTGIVIDNCSGKPVIERLYMRGVNPGFANFPPGETFGINVHKSPNTTIRDTEIDGRDVAGNRTSASPIGWNNVVNDTTTVNVQRVYTHHGLASMLTFWETTNIITEDYYTYSWSSGTGDLSGSGINHEQSGGRIRHIRPRLFLNGSKSSGPVSGKYGHPASDNTAKTATNGATFSLQSGLTDAGKDFQMLYPEWDNTLGTSGILCMDSHDGYALGQDVKTAPLIVIKNSANADYDLVKIDHPKTGWSTANPLVDYAWIH